MYPTQENIHIGISFNILHQVFIMFLNNYCDIPCTVYITAVLYVPKSTTGLSCNMNLSNLLNGKVQSSNLSVYQLK